MRQHGYGCACADCGRDREERKASDLGTARALIAEMDRSNPHTDEEIGLR